MDLRRRIDKPELMDTEPLSLREMKGALRFLEITNLYFGGIPLVLRFLGAWSRCWTPGETLRLLDVGTGGAEIPVAIARWARARNLKVKIVAIDLVPEIVEIARANARAYPEIEIRQDDFFAVANRGEKFDYAIANLFLHHTPPERAGLVLQTFDLLTERGVVIGDLLRTAPSYHAINLLCKLIGNRIVRHDGPLSVRRAFIPEELRQLAVTARVPYLKARKEPWFRVSLAGEKIHVS